MRALNTKLTAVCSILSDCWRPPNYTGLTIHQNLGSSEEPAWAMALILIVAGLPPWAHPPILDGMYSQSTSVSYSVPDTSLKFASCLDHQTFFSGLLVLPLPPPVPLLGLGLSRSLSYSILKTIRHTRNTPSLIFGLMGPLKTLYLRTLITYSLHVT